jgi:hypothetical protein
MAVQVPAWLRDKKVWAFAGAGGGLGLLVYLQRRKRGQQSGVDPTTGQQVANPATFDDAGINAYQNLQNEFESLQSNVSSQLDILGNRIDALPDAQQAVTPHPAPKLGWTTQLHRIGVPGKTYNLRDIARRFAPNPASASSVEYELQRIVAANPSLRGKTTLPGGFALQTPTYKAVG